MSNVIELSKRSKAAVGVRDIRNEYGLLLIQAAQALDTSPTTLETWEANPGMGPSVEYVRAKLEDFIVQHGPDAGKNLLFGLYPLRMARELLRLSIDEIAVDQGYTKAAWQKFEANSRKLDSSRIEALEERVREHFIEACGVSRR